MSRKRVLIYGLLGLAVSLMSCAFLVYASSGSIKFSPWDAPLFEDSLGYFEYHNGTAVEMRQVWFFEGNNGTAGCSISPESVNMVIYLHFYNEDPYEKEVYIQVAKSWREPNYQSWI